MATVSNNCAAVQTGSGCQLPRYVWLIAYLLVSSLPAAHAATLDSRVDGQYIVDSVYRSVMHEFGDTTSAAREAVAERCTGSSEALSLSPAFDQLVVAFSRVEPLKLGPLLEDNRINRLFYWPDTRRAGERQLRAFKARVLDESLTSTDIVALLPEQSVALQGLPALERLLRSELTPTDCMLARAVAEHIDFIGVQLIEAWDKADGLSAAMINPNKDHPLIRSRSELLRSLLTQTDVALERIAEAKLVPVVEGDERAATRLPFWRSGLWLKHLQGNMNTVTLILMDSKLAAEAGVERAAGFELRNIERLMLLLEQQIAVQNPPVSLDEEVQSVARALQAGVRGLRTLIAEQMAPSLGVHIGFNSNDGD